MAIEAKADVKYSYPEAIFVTVLGVIVVAGVTVLLLSLQFWQTYVAMTLWRWFAPWPLPFGLVAGVGMTIAARMVFWKGASGKDERTATEKWKDTFYATVLAPLVALGFGAALRMFL